MASAVAAREDRTTYGVVIMALSILFMTMIDTSAKWLVIAGIPVIQVVFMRYAIHFFLSLFVTIPKDGLEVLRSNAIPKQILRALFLLASTVFLVLALRTLPITLNTAIVFTMPILVTLLAIPILGEKVGMHRICAVLIGFCGVLVVLQPWGAKIDPAMLYSFGVVVTGALYMIMTRMLAGIDKNATSQIWSSGLATVCLLPFALLQWVWPETTVDYAFLLLIGVFGATAHTLLTAAHRFADTSILAPVLYIQMVFATLAGIIFFNTFPTIWTLVGAVIIICSGLYIWHRERGNTPT